MCEGDKAPSANQVAGSHKMAAASLSGTRVLIPPPPTLLSWSIELNHVEAEQTIVKLKTLLSRIAQYRRDQKQQGNSSTPHPSNLTLGKSIPVGESFQGLIHDL